MELKKTLELEIEEREQAVEHLDGYINQMDQRLEDMELKVNEMVALTMEAMDNIIAIDRRLLELEKEKRLFHPRIQPGLDLDEGGAQE